MIRSNFTEVNDLAELNYILLRDVVPANPANFAMGNPIDKNPKTYEEVTKIMFGPPPGVDLTMVTKGDYIHVKCYDGGQAIYKVDVVNHATNHFDVEFFEKGLEGFSVNLFEDYDVLFFRAVDSSPIVSFNDHLLMDVEPYQPFHIAIPPYATVVRDWSQVTQIKFGSPNDLSMIEVGYLFYMRYTSDDKQGRYIISKVDLTTNTLDLFYIGDTGGQVKVSEQYDIFIRDEITPERNDGINFPEDPTPGQKYTYNLVEYTWILVPQVVKPDRGFWFASRVETRPFMPIDLKSNKMMVPFPDVVLEDYHYKIHKPNNIGTIRVSNHNIIMAPYGNPLDINTVDLTLPGDYFIYGEDTIFEGSDADWEFQNQTIRKDVTSFTNFLKDCPNYNGNGGDNLRIWDLSHITLMDSTFENATSFNQDITGWNTARVVTMERMFHQATAFDQDIHLWCVRQMISRPTLFDVGSGFQSQFDKQPIWGTCPLNQDGLNMIGNVNIIGPDAALIDNNEIYTWDNDGNYTDDGYQLVEFDEKWSVKGVLQPSNDLYFPPPGEYVDVDVVISSRYASDSPQTGKKTVYTDGSLNSLGIIGPSIVNQYIKTEYYVTAVGTGAGRVKYTWTNEGRTDNMLVEDISGKGDYSIVNIYFVTPSPAVQLCVKPNTDQQNIEACKTIVVNDTGGANFSINGPNTVFEDSVDNRYELIAPNGFNVTSTHATAGGNTVKKVGNFNYTIDIDVDRTRNKSYFVISWTVYFATGSITVSKKVNVGCDQRTVTLNASSFKNINKVQIGAPFFYSDYDYDEEDNFKKDDWYDPCCNLVLNIDTNVYGGLWDPDTSVGYKAEYAYPGIAIMFGLRGRLTVNIFPGVTVTGGPGLPQCWNIYHLHTQPGISFGDKFSDRPTYGDCESPPLGRNETAGYGLTGIDIYGSYVYDNITPENEGIVINNNGTIQGGGGGGTMGGLGQSAKTTNCSGCTRGGVAGSGGWGAGGGTFYENRNWWPNGSSAMIGDPGIGPGGSNGLSGAGGTGGNGGGIAARGSEGGRGKLKGSNQSGYTGCSNGPYDAPYKSRTGRAGYAIETAEGVTINNNGTITGGIERLSANFKTEKALAIQYLDEQFKSGKMTRNDCATYLAEHNPDVYLYLRDRLIIGEEELKLIDEKTWRQDKPERDEINN